MIAHFTPKREISWHSMYQERRLPRCRIPLSASYPSVRLDVPLPATDPPPTTEPGHGTRPVDGRIGTLRYGSRRDRNRERARQGEPREDRWVVTVASGL